MPKFTGNPSTTIPRYSQRFQDSLLKAIDLRTQHGRWLFHRFIMRTGRRGGKTKTGADATRQKAAGIAGGLSWAAAPTFPKMEDYVFPALERAIPAAWVKDWAAQNWTLTLKNGHVIKLRSLDDIERGRGPGLNWLWIDEARDVALTAWKALEPALVDAKGQALLTTTPNGRDWCDTKFFQPAVKGVPGYWATRYRTIDNPVFQMDPELRQEVEEARATADPLWFAQEYEGEVVTFAGAVYGENLENQIIRDREAAGLDFLKRLIPEWPEISPDRYCGFGLDPGSDHPFAGAFGVRGDGGHLVFCGEYLEREKTIAEHVRLLRGVLDWFNPAHPPRPEIWPIDKSQKQFSIELAIHGIIPVAAPNAVVPGITRFQAWLGAGKMWFVESRCPRLIEQLRNYRYTETKEFEERRKERVIKLDDDLPDAARYLVMAWPDLPTVEDLDTNLRTFPNGEVPWDIARMRRIEALDRDDNDRGIYDEDEPGLMAEVENPLGEFYG